jgi:hypothetical protein
MKLVVDKNILQDDVLEDFLRESSSNYAVLCGYAGIESYTGNAIVNITKSMQVLSRFPRQVLVLRGAAAILKIGEIKPEFRFDMVHWQQTRAFPAFCASLIGAQNNEQVARDLISSSAQAAEDHVAKMIDSAALFAQIIDEYHRVTDRDTLNAIRNHTAIPGEAALRILEEMYELAARIYSYQSGVPKPRNATSARDFYIFRYAVGMRLLALWWAKNGGIANVKPENLKNDIADLEYAVCATYFDGLLTRDDKMKSIYGEAAYLLNEIFPKL